MDHMFILTFMDEDGEIYTHPMTAPSLRSAYEYITAAIDYYVAYRINHLSIVRSYTERLIGVCSIGSSDFAQRRHDLIKADDKDKYTSRQRGVITENNVFVKGLHQIVNIDSDTYQWSIDANHSFRIVPLSQWADERMI